MKMTSLQARCKDELWSELDAIACDEQLKLYDVESFGNGGLRIFVQSPVEPKSQNAENVQGGISLDDCSRLCRRLMVFFEAEGARFSMPAEPVLEVSSPGVNRVLKYKEHFMSAVGERVKVTLEQPVSVSDQQLGVLCGVLSEADEDCITVAEEESETSVSVDYSSISKARVDFQFT